MPVFYGGRLTLAREYRGLTRKALADQIEVSAQSITNYEEKESQPSPEKITLLSLRLAFPEAFFFAGDIELPAEQRISFRSRYALKASSRGRAIATGLIATELVSPRLHKRFQMPKTDVPDFAGEEPERAAQLLRDYWQLGVGPIHNMVHLLERRGIEVYWTGEPSPLLDAFCLWRDDKPFVMLNLHKLAGDRARFDAGHELGHLVLHRHEKEIDGPRLEAQADEFAAAFLMPETQFRYESPKIPMFNEYLALKPRWKVSIQAMIRRGRDLGIFNDWYYEKAYKTLSIRGWRKDEPIPIPREQSLLHKMAFDSMALKQITPIDFARSLDISEQELLVVMPTAAAYLSSTPDLQSSEGKVFVRDGVALRLIE